MNFLRFNLNDILKKEWKKAWKIYGYSFPEYEKRSLENQLLALSDEDYFCCGIMNSEKLSGIICYWKYDEGVYIEHLAIAQENRNEGLGTKVLGHLKKSEKSIIFEVDPQVDEISRRRVAFYKRLGFLESSFDYCHPALDEKSAPYNLEIMTYPETIGRPEFAKFVDFINKKPMKYTNNPVYI